MALDGAGPRRRRWRVRSPGARHRDEGPRRYPQSARRGRPARRATPCCGRRARSPFGCPRNGLRSRPPSAGATSRRVRPMHPGRRACGGGGGGDEPRGPPSASTTSTPVMARSPSSCRHRRGPVPRPRRGSLPRGGRGRAGPQRRARPGVGPGGGLARVQPGSSTTGHGACDGSDEHQHECCGDDPRSEVLTSPIGHSGASGTVARMSFAALGGGLLGRGAFASDGRKAAGLSMRELAARTECPNR